MACDCFFWVGSYHSDITCDSVFSTMVTCSTSALAYTIGYANCVWCNVILIFFFLFHLWRIMHLTHTNFFNVRYIFSIISLVLSSPPTLHPTLLPFSIFCVLCGFLYVFWPLYLFICKMKFKIIWIYFE